MTDVYARSRARIVAAGLVRPADEAPYAPGDVICNSTSTPQPLAFAGASLDPRVGCGLIAYASLACTANQATRLDAELWLFTVAPAMDADNAPFTPTTAELSDLVAIVTLASAWAAVGNAQTGADGNVVITAPLLSIPFACAPGDSSLYGVLVARNAYVPVAGEAFRLALGILD